MSYHNKIALDAPFDSVVDALTDTLGEEGFGVLADIDIQDIFAEKLDVQRDEYRIFGACNPPLANQGIEAEIDLGTLLPCNVVVYAEDGDVIVSAADPTELIDLTGNPELDEIATEIGERLDRVLEELESEFPAGSNA
ncbi:DUF302 domain-containing protein [Halodesulfurarchaeum sp. HSR-GB]|uniref:DUF302 domain-containing protein n=1 Tax=Halodesulfurarchaeum sp. HSR-GB TaxID=3074077 RepID=UPI0028614AA8|nr:DUF302 domain-containing protein [Halodesulfurarchaeum sp. HSR-GB]MDR5657587.1 DUF302 domain-containing protein [Halodesulfurarchaeum sp. HSR-GB]